LSNINIKKEEKKKFDSVVLSMRKGKIEIKKLKANIKRNLKTLV